MSTRNKAIRILMILAAVVVLATFVTPAVQAADGGAESSLLGKINNERAKKGLNKLSSAGDLRSAARAHSERMRSQGKLYHNPNLGGVSSGWDKLGENVGVGPNANVLHSAFMSSAAHRNNILGDYTHVGVGVIREGNNKIWVTVVFKKAKGGGGGASTNTNDDGKKSNDSASSNNTNNNNNPPAQDTSQSEPKPKPEPKPEPKPKVEEPPPPMAKTIAKRQWACERSFAPKNMPILENCAV